MKRVEVEAQRRRREQAEAAVRRERDEAERELLEYARLRQKFGPPVEPPTKRPVEPGDRNIEL